MNILHLLSRGKHTLTIIVLLTCLNAPAAAEEKGCWADFYEYAEFIGDNIRVWGPISLNRLKNIHGENWESRIDSIITGPKSKVTIYENIDFKLTLTEMAKHPVLMESLGISMDEIREESELIFHPNEKIRHLGVYNFHQKTKSLRIECL